MQSFLTYHWLICPSSPRYTRFKIVQTKNFFRQLQEIVHFIIIDTDENNSILCQQIFCQFQPRINHIEPIRMKTAIAFGVCHHAVAFFVILAAVFHVILGALCKVVLIDKIIAGVVRRVNVDHLDLAQIGFLQELQHFQIVALDIEVFAVKAAGCAILANTVGTTGRNVAVMGALAANIAFFLSGQVN